MPTSLANIEVHYSYPSSPNADAWGYADGCYHVDADGVVIHKAADIAGVVAFLRGLNDWEWSQYWSFCFNAHYSCAVKVMEAFSAT